MVCAPLLNSVIKRKLREINPHFYAEWDRKRSRWNIMSKLAGHKSFFVCSVRDEYGKYIPIDGRTYRKLRKQLWYNRKLGEYVWDLMYAEERMNAAKDVEEYNLYKDMAKEMRRPVQMLSRELGLTSGKAKLPYSPGFGKGQLGVRPY